MLHVIGMIMLTILKLLGIILGVLLLLLCLVLFVPIRYRIDFIKEEEITLHARISWLLSAVTLLAGFEKKAGTLKVRVLGVSVYDSLQPKERRVKKQKQKKKGQRQSKSVKDEEKITDEQKITDQEKIADKKNENTEQNSSTQKKVKKEKESFEKRAPKEETAAKRKNKNKNRNKNRNKNKNKSVVRKIKNFLKTVFSLPVRIKEWFQKIRENGSKLIEKVQGINHKGNKILTFLKSEESRLVYGKLFLTIKKLLTYIHPKKMSLHIRFGTGDPCTTGQALGAFSILFAFYGQNISVEPDFLESVFEAELHAKGSVTCFRLIWLVIKIYLDKHFQHFLSEVNSLKEEL